MPTSMPVASAVPSILKGSVEPSGLAFESPRGENCKPDEPNGNAKLTR